MSFDGPFKGPFDGCSFEGPIYADRVNHRLTFRDWDHWEEADKAKWSDEYEMHCTRLRMWAEMDAGTFSLDDLS